LGSAVTMSGGSAALTTNGLSVATHSITQFTAGMPATSAAPRTILSRGQQPSPCSRPTWCFPSPPIQMDLPVGIIGTPQAAYYVISHTNVSDPVANWTLVARQLKHRHRSGRLWYFTATIRVGPDSTAGGSHVVRDHACGPDAFLVRIRTACLPSKPLWTKAKPRHTLNP